MVTVRARMCWYGCAAKTTQSKVRYGAVLYVTLSVVILVVLDLYATNTSHVRQFHPDEKLRRYPPDKAIYTLIFKCCTCLSGLIVGCVLPGDQTEKQSLTLNCDGGNVMCGIGQNTI